MTNPFHPAQKNIFGDPVTGPKRPANYVHPPMSNPRQKPVSQIHAHGTVAVKIVILSQLAWGILSESTKQALQPQHDKDGRVLHKLMQEQFLEATIVCDTQVQDAVQGMSQQITFATLDNTQSLQQDATTIIILVVHQLQKDRPFIVSSAYQIATETTQ